MERQSTSKLFRALIAIVAFFVLCTSAILFASCASDPRTCEHPNVTDGDVLSITKATCSTNGSVTYKCPDCKAQVTLVVTIATGEHNFSGDVCSVCGAKKGTTSDVTLSTVRDVLQQALTALDGKISDNDNGLKAIKDSIQSVIDSLNGTGDTKGVVGQLTDILGKLDKAATGSDLAAVKSTLDTVAQTLKGEGNTGLAAQVTDILGKLNATDLTTVPALNALKTAILSALTDPNTGSFHTLQAHLDQVLAAMEDNLGAKIDAIKDIEITLPPLTAPADGGDGDEKPLTLGEALGKIYQQVQAVNDNVAKLVGTGEGSLKQYFEDATALLTSANASTTSDHLHNWVLTLKKAEGVEADAEEKWSCLEAHTYEYTCAICGTKMPVIEGQKNEVTLNATGHVENFHAVQYELDEKSVATLKTEGLADTDHFIAATCISPARVEAKCAVCGQWTGEWTSVGLPTYKHNYVADTKTEGGNNSHGCTSNSGDVVLHCETCGGAYLQKSEDKNQNKDHNYYFQPNEDGSKRPMEEDEKVAVWNDPKGDRRHIDSLSELNAAEVKELNELLEDFLNVVYFSEPNCVDPALIVVECVDCGVRYAYSFGLPNGHTFTQVHEESKATCTTDGLKAYYYCEECGYYFFLDDAADQIVKDYVKQHSTAAATISAIMPIDEPATNPLTALYERNKYTRKYMTDLNGTVLNGDDKETQQKAYDSASVSAPAKGHSYVTVYTNVAKCVTSQDYILVCTECFHDAAGNKFDKLVDGKEGAAATTYFEQKDGQYYVKGLTGNPTADQTEVNKVLALVTNDEASTDTPSDLTKEWTALDKTDRVSVFAWLATHGYLVRDAKDDEVFGSITATAAKAWYQDGELKPEKKTEIEGYLAALDELAGDTFDLADLYAAKNVIDGLTLPVEGHHFTDKFITVVGNCVMYERHVYFCDVCGQATGDHQEERNTDGTWQKPVDQSNAPFVVTGDSDVLTAGYGENLDPVPEGFKTDLAKIWETKTDDNNKIEFLAEYGYLVDYGVAKGGKYDVSALNTTLTKAAGAQGLTAFLNSFFGTNVLPEFTVTEDEHGEIVLGHKFDTVTLIGEVQSCTAPGQYVYVCSECGVTTTSANKLTYQSGPNTVNTGLTVVLEANRTFQSDNDLFEKAVPESRRGEDKDFTKTDLQADWNGLGTELKTDWLLNKGYLNNVIDTYFMSTLKEEDGTFKLHDQAAYDEAKKAIHEGKVLTGALTEEAKTAIIALATKIAKDNGAVSGEEGDITVYYTKSSETEVTGSVPANKTWSKAATETPQAGHLFTKGDGTPYDETTDPLCKDFADPTLTKLYNDEKVAAWDDEKGWIVATDEGHEITFDKDDLDQDFRTQADKYGILAACKRPNCPLHTKAEADKAKAAFTAGYIAATDHQLSYEKFTADGKTGLPTTTVETLEGGEHVYYNNNSWGDYLDAGVVDSQDKVVPGKTTLATTAQEKAAREKKDADLHNLHTLERYWNALFIPAEWLNTAERTERYPVIKLPMKNGKVDIDQLTETFTQAGVEPLWKGTVDNLVSAWRPINDQSDAPSCWVSQRCHWYHAGTDKNGDPICNRIEPPNNHSWPLPGDFGYDTHVANCQHKDLCDTCGDKIGTKGDHNLLRVSPDADENDLESDTLRSAWVKILEVFHADNEKVAWLKGIVEFADDVDFSNFDWANDWWILKDTCLEEEKVSVRDEDTHELSSQTNHKEDGHIIYVCSGELEVIYNKMVKGGADGTAEWDEVVCKDADHDPETCDKLYWQTSETKDAEGNNYFVQTVDEVDHKYEIRYYLDGKEYTQKEWDEYAKFSESVCMGGYYTQRVCVNKGRDGQFCYHVEEGSKVVYDYSEKGHTLAPIENYRDHSGYKAKTATENATMLHVCVVCGKTFGTVYAASGRGNIDGQMYTNANAYQIDEWNNYVETWNAAHKTEMPKWKAQMPLAEDLLDGVSEGGNPTYLVGVNAYDEAASTLTASEGNGEIMIGIDKSGKTADTTVLVGANAKLTVNAKYINTYGNVAFVGNDRATSEVDLTALDCVVASGDLLFENCTVDLADAPISITLGATVTFRNCTVKNAGSLLTMNNSMPSNSTVVVEDSTLINTAGYGLSVWDRTVTVEATGSVFVGKAGGALIRSGNATFTDCVFVTEAGASGKNTGWNGTDNVAGHGAIVVGNGATGVSSYGDAYVTLNSCTFGTYTDSYDAETELGACSDTDPSIAAFANKQDSTLVTLNAATKASAKVVKETEPDDKDSCKVITTPSADELSKPEVLQSLIQALGTDGGTLVLPEDLEEPVVIDKLLDVKTGKEVVIELSQGTLELGKGVMVEGKLTVSGGDLVVANREGEGANTALKVRGEEANLTLNGVQLTVTDAAAHYAISAGTGATVNVNNSLVYSSVGMALGTNNTTGASAKFVLVNSAFMSDVNATAAKADGGIFATLINNEKAEIYAGGCTFYGANGAVLLRGAKKAVFVGCTFISGGVASVKTEWSTGTELPNTVLAAVVVGNGKNTDYGSVFVEITDCDVYFANTAESQGAPEATVTKPSYSFEFGKELVGEEHTGKDYYIVTKDEEHTVKVPTYAAPEAVALADGVLNNKLFTVSACGAKLTEVLFSDKATAQKFLGEDLKLEENVNEFFYDGASDWNVNVAYYVEDGDDEDNAPDLVHIDPLVEKVKAFFDKPHSYTFGYTLTLPSEPEEWYNEDWSMKEEYIEGTKNFRGGNIYLGDVYLTHNNIPGHGSVLDLGGNTLLFEDLDGNGIAGISAGAMTIKDGVIDGGSVDVVGSKSLHLSGVQINNPEGNGVYAATTGTVSIRDCQIDAKIPLNVDDVDGNTCVVEALHSNFLGQGGYGALITEDVKSGDFVNCWFFGHYTACLVRSGNITFSGCVFTTNSATNRYPGAMSWTGKYATLVPQEALGVLTIVSFVDGPALGDAQQTRPAPSVTIEKTSLDYPHDETLFAELKRAGNGRDSYAWDYFNSESGLKFTERFSDFEFEYTQESERTKEDVSLVVVLNGETQSEKKLSLTCTGIEGLQLQMGKNVHVYNATHKAEVVGWVYTVTEKEGAQSTDYFTVTGAEISPKA